MAKQPSPRFTLDSLRNAMREGKKTPMLTCYDYSTARIMAQAGVPMILVGDSAASVILGHPSTLPVSLEFMIEITAAVRRGAPDAFLVADMPFGSYQASIEQGVNNVVTMVQKTGCDCVKMEVSEYHLPLVTALTAAGVAIMGHIGLKPQSVNLLGGYKTQGKTVLQAMEIVRQAVELEMAGAVALLVEAVPPAVSAEIVKRTHVPVIGCGAGSACHGCVIVTHDGIGMTDKRPRFVPELGNLADPMRKAFDLYISMVRRGDYPAKAHDYAILPGEVEEFKRLLETL